MTPVVEVTLGELEKLIFLHKTKRNLSFRVTWCFFSFSSSGTSDIQGRYSPKGIDLYPYIWKRPNSLQNYIHRIYVSRGRFTFFKIGTPPNSIGFHCKLVFFSLFYGTGRGGNLGELEKHIFFTQNKKKLIISGDLVFFFIFQFRNFRHPAQRELIYTLIYGRVPFRTTYIDGTNQKAAAPCVWAQAACRSQQNWR